LFEEVQPEEKLPDATEFELLDYLEKSKSLGLGRNPWVRGFERKFATTGRLVTEPLYNAIIDRLVTDGYVIRGGDGRPHQWALGWDADSVYAKECMEFEAEWGNVVSLKDTAAAARSP